MLHRLKKKRFNLKIIDDYLPFILIFICVASARFIESDLIVFSIYILALFIYVWRRYDARMFVGAAIFLLVACAVLLVLGYEGYANEVAVWVYYFLVDGVIGLFIDYLREERSKSKISNRDIGGEKS